jgi:hypothetical protein
MMSAAVRGVLLLIAGLLLAGGGALAMLGAVPAAVGLTAWGLILIVGRSAPRSCDRAAAPRPARHAGRGRP